MNLLSSPSPDEIKAFFEPHTVHGERVKLAKPLTEPHARLLEIFENARVGRNKDGMSRRLRIFTFLLEDKPLRYTRLEINGVIGAKGSQQLSNDLRWLTNSRFLTSGFVSPTVKEYWVS